MGSFNGAAYYTTPAAIDRLETLPQLQGNKSVLVEALRAELKNWNALPDTGGGVRGILGKVSQGLSVLGNAAATGVARAYKGTKVDTDATDPSDVLVGPDNSPFFTPKTRELAQGIAYTNQKIKELEKPSSTEEDELKSVDKMKTSAIRNGSQQPKTAQEYYDYITWAAAEEDAGRLNEQEVARVVQMINGMPDNILKEFVEIVRRNK